MIATAQHGSPCRCELARGSGPPTSGSSGPRSGRRPTRRFDPPHAEGCDAHLRRRTTLSAAAYRVIRSADPSAPANASWAAGLPRQTDSALTAEIRLAGEGSSRHPMSVDTASFTVAASNSALCSKARAASVGASLQHAADSGTGPSVRRSSSRMVRPKESSAQLSSMPVESDQDAKTGPRVSYRDDGVTCRRGPPVRRHAW